MKLFQCNKLNLIVELRSWSWSTTEFRGLSGRELGSLQRIAIIVFLLRFDDDWFRRQFFAWSTWPRKFVVPGTKEFFVVVVLTRPVVSLSSTCRKILTTKGHGRDSKNFTTIGALHNCVTWITSELSRCL